MKISRSIFNLVAVNASPWRPVNDNVMGGVSEGAVVASHDWKSVNDNVMGGVSEGEVWKSVNDNVMGGISEGEVWKSVNDNVMGGVSDGFVIPSGEIVHFWGELKAENNGGFASVRKEIAYGSLEGKSGIRFEAKATNRDFRMNLTPKTDNEWGIANFEIDFSATTSWQTYEFDFDDFKYNIMGLTPPDAPKLAETLYDVHELGFIISDKIFNVPFLLSVKNIEAY